jgi:spore maturation protein CgeB
MPAPLNIIFLGLTVTSSWGNGHATNYRCLLRALSERGHRVLFLERDQPWYADNRDLRRPPWGRTELYTSLTDLKRRFSRQVRDADAVILGSYVPQGIAVGEWLTRTAHGVRVFYDIDTPVTLAALSKNTCQYLSPHLIPRLDLYLSFTGGPTLRRLERIHGSPMARAFYCMVDPKLYHPSRPPGPGHRRTFRFDLGYLGTYSLDRQGPLSELLIEPATAEPTRRFIVAGPQYPADIQWPRNVKRIEHLPPKRHRAFYNSQRFTLNVTRADMRKAGFSPSVRLFEAAACGTPIISDAWPGINEVLEPGSEVLLAESAGDVLRILRTTTEAQRRAICQRARRRVLAQHTAEHRAQELEQHLAAAAAAKSGSPPALAVGA